MKILIIKYRNIGDVLLATPLIENLKLNYPDSHIDVAINKNCQDMVTLNPNINQIYLYDRNFVKQKNIFNRFYEEIKYVKNIVSNKYDIVINLTEGDRGALISLFSKAKNKLGFKPRKGILKLLNIYNKIGDDQTTMHTVEKDIQFIKLLNKKIFSKKVSLFWSMEDEKFVNSILQDNQIKEFVHIHPVSRWMFKCWEDDRMAKAIDYFQQNKNLNVIITASNEQVEQDRVEKILSLCDSSPLNLTGELTLKQLACLSQKSNLFFGIDSAPMHIAAAVDTKVIALFGGSFPKMWGPWDNNKLDSSFQNINGLQINGNHKIFSNMDHEIFYINNIKKSKGMNNITLDDFGSLID